jgi:hypothetical protein
MKLWNTEWNILLYKLFLQISHPQNVPKDLEEIMTYFECAHVRTPTLKRKVTQNNDTQIVFCLNQKKSIYILQCLITLVNFCYTD